VGKVLLVSSPKGGSGKSVLARHFLVSARQASIDALGIDFDRQGTFDKWGQRRLATLQDLPGFVTADVKVGHLQDWRAGLKIARAPALAILDTPPSVEDHLAAISSLADAADLIVVPAVCTQDDVDSVAPWVEVLAKRGLKPVIILNRANRRTTSFSRFRGKYLQVADVCPVEIPLLEDVHVPASNGLTLHDYDKSRGQDYFRDVWSYVSRRLDL
jgi:chromosome partitioning protein